MPGYSWFLYLHIASGVIALATFWSAACLRKGSPRHRFVGKVFLLAMCGILASGVPLALHHFLLGKTVGGSFLTYLLLITAQAMWLAWRAVTDKRDWRKLVARPGWRLLMVGTALAGVAVLALGISRGIPLLIGFSLIGIMLGVRMWRFARRGPRHTNWHVVMHYQSMLGAGIATHVAFLGIGMRPVWRWLGSHVALPSALVELFPWFAPVVVALLAGVWLDRKYARPVRAGRVAAAVADSVSAN